MNRITLPIFLAMLIQVFILTAQESQNSLPNTSVENLEGETTNTSTFDNEGQPMIISFWATWCKPCIQELNAISDEYEDWQEETGVKLIAISIDDARNMHLVAPFVNAKSWPYEVYIDENSDFKRAMNVANVPHTFLFNGNKEIVYQHTSYAPGDEEELYEKILEAAAALEE